MVPSAEAEAVVTTDAERERASGRWSKEEHEEFVRCLSIYGREWKKVESHIKTRTAAQIRSHAQKWFKKCAAAKKAGSPSCESAGAYDSCDAGSSETSSSDIAPNLAQAAVASIDEMLSALQTRRREYTSSDDERQHSTRESSTERPRSDSPPLCTTTTTTTTAASLSLVQNHDDAGGSACVIVEEYHNIKLSSSAEEVEDEEAAGGGDSSSSSSPSIDAAANVEPACTSGSRGKVRALSADEGGDILDESVLVSFPVSHKRCRIRPSPTAAPSKVTAGCRPSPLRLPPAVSCDNLQQLVATSNCRSLAESELVALEVLCAGKTVRGS